MIRKILINLLGRHYSFTVFFILTKKYLGMKHVWKYKIVRVPRYLDNVLFSVDFFYYMVAFKVAKLGRY